MSAEAGASNVLSRDEFARAFERERRVLACLAAAVLGSRERAEDVVQEAALVALSKLEEFVPGTHFGAWTARIVRLVALNHGRTHARSRAHGAGGAHVDVGTLASAHTSGALALDFDDRLMQALGTLSETARAALLLRTVLELDYAEIAARLEIAEGTAMSHVHRSRERLRAALRDERAPDGRSP